MKLDNHTNKFSIVIGANSCPMFECNVLRLIELYGGQFLYILHNKDNEYIHYHLIVIYDKQVKYSTMLNRLSSVLETPKDNISINGVRNINASVQYLIHLNHKDKYQYAPIDVIHNLTNELFNSYLYTLSYDIELSIELLVDIVHQAHTKMDIMLQVGLYNYSRYRNVINDMWSELKIKI